MNWFSRILFVLMLVSINPIARSYAVASAFTAPEDGLGNITGRIMGDLLPVVSAEVVLMDKDKVIDKTTTDQHGRYAFRYVRPGRYDVKCSKTDYRTSIITEVPVTEDHVTKNDFYLPKINTKNMLQNPIVDNYEDNCRKYMRQK